MRYILGLVGAVFSVVLLISFFSNVSTYLTSPPPATQSRPSTAPQKASTLAAGEEGSGTVRR